MALEQECLLSFRSLPLPLELPECHLSHRSIRLADRSLHLREALREFIVSLPQRGLRLDPELAGKVGDREQKIAHFFFRAFVIDLAGSAAAMPLSSVFGLVGEPLDAFSRALISSHRTRTWPAESSGASPASRANTCGWRRTSLSAMLFSESAIVKWPASDSSCARNTASNTKSPSSSQSAG